MQLLLFFGYFFFGRGVGCSPCAANNYQGLLGSIMVTSACNDFGIIIFNLERIHMPFDLGICGVKLVQITNLIPPPKQ